MNFHHGMHFVGTRDFKPEGEPRWQAIPELTEEEDRLAFAHRVRQLIRGD